MTQDDIERLDDVDVREALHGEIDPGAVDALDSDVDLLDDAAGEGAALPDEVRAELEALAAAELDGGGELEQALATAQRELARQRAQAQAVLARYREAVLAAEPDLPPELVRGETLEELEAAISAAREVVARVRERVRADTPARGFPIGAPGRDAGVQRALTPAEKIARGLDDRR